MNALRGVLSLFVAILKAISPDQADKAWWVRIKAENPEYTYYFGPFQVMQSAEAKLPGFIEDLQAENAKVSQSRVLWCNPPKVTIEGNHLPA